MQSHDPICEQKRDNLCTEDNRQLHQSFGDEVSNDTILLRCVLTQEDWTLIWKGKQDWLSGAHHGRNR